MTERDTGDRRRTQIVGAARALLRSEGAGALSMAAVAHRAGVSRRTLYRYFPSRRELARAAEAPASASAPAPNRPPATASTADGRRRILLAAQELFTAQGYAATSLREIATRAEISQPMLYRYFPTKEALFLEAAVAPLNIFIDAYIGRTGLGVGLADESLLAETRAICGHIHALLAHNRELLLLLLADRAWRAGESRTHPLSTLFEHSLQRMTRGLDELTERRDLGLEDRSVVIRLFFGMALSTALHSDWLFPDRHDQERVLDEMAALLVQGIDRSGSR